MADLTDTSSEPHSQGQSLQKPRRNAAVAIKNNSEEGFSPEIAASGYGYWAEKILEIAFASGVKVRKDEDLAQMLVALEQETRIPSEALVAIAEILAYVYRANGDKAALGRMVESLVSQTEDARREQEKTHAQEEEQRQKAQKSEDDGTLRKADERKDWA